MLNHKCTQDFRLGAPNRKSHAMMLSEIFEKRDILWDKDTVRMEHESRALGWHAIWILLKREDLNQKLKTFPEASKLGTW